MNIETISGKKIDCADVSKVSLRDMYLRMCECRDLEIAHVWHRAIFLTAFLLGCFTAYGTVALKMFSGHEFAYSRFLNLGSFLIALVGIVMSLFWIMMAKGSKAWYELYESAISAFVVEHPGGVDKGVTELSQFKWRKMVIKAHAKDPKITEEVRNKNIFSTSGGPYSVSRINVSIGIVSFLIWIVIAGIHIVTAFKFEGDPNGCFLKIARSLSELLVSPWALLLILVVAVIGLPFLFLWMAKSEHLSKSETDVLKG